MLHLDTMPLHNGVNALFLLLKNLLSGLAGEGGRSCSFTKIYPAEKGCKEEMVTFIHILFKYKTC